MKYKLLGRSGLRVSELCLGCATFGTNWGSIGSDKRESGQIFDTFVEAGGNFFDTSNRYQESQSEEFLGTFIRANRDRHVLATKYSLFDGFSDGNDPNACGNHRKNLMRSVEGSLKRLNTDYVDLVHIHSLGQEDDLARIEAPEGALKGLMEARDQKMAHFVGMTSHTNGGVMAKAIERHDLDCVQMALNASRNGRFEEVALPAANAKSLGVIAMKVTGQEFLVGDGPGKAQMSSLLRYSMSLPVATAVVGMPKPEMLTDNVEMARGFSVLDDNEKERLRQQLQPSREGLEKRLVGHLDGPTAEPRVFVA